MADNGDKLMTLGEAYDALGDQITRFHNDMIDEKVKELLPREWARWFMSWFSEFEFEQDYIETMKFIEECERRDAERAASLPDTPEAP